MTGAIGWASARRRLIDGLTIHDPEVRRAMLTVPRHEFVPEDRIAEAYDDEPVSLGPRTATSSAPHMVVLLAEALGLRPGDHVLELGAGMGYLCAIVAELVGPSGRIDAMEIDPGLAAEARQRLGDLGYGPRVTVRAADGAPGLAEAAPFDGIVVSFAVPFLAPAWKEQLAERGRLVAPVGDAYEQRLVTFTRRGLGGRSVTGPRCRFVAQQHRTPAPI